jgi:hypothetical protein
MIITQAAGAGKVLVVVVGWKAKNESPAFMLYEVQAAAGDVLQVPASTLNHRETQSLFVALGSTSNFKTLRY